MGLLMNMINKLIRMRHDLTRHDYRYYILNNPSISDQDYDHMYKRYNEKLIELIGRDTHSLERTEEYPQWVLDEFGDTKPIT